MLESHFTKIVATITFTLAMLLTEGVMAEEAQPLQTSGEEAFTAFPRIVDFDFVAHHVLVQQYKDVTLVDSRPPRKFKEGSIVNSINIPESSFDEMVDRLPKDKNSLLIFYCGGLKCPLSHKSAFAAEKLGYTNAAVYAAGYPDWAAHGNPHEPMESGR